MSEKHFEAFLIKNLRDWLKSRIEPGARYQFKSPDPENTKKLVDQLATSRDGVLSVEDQKLSFLNVENQRLIIAGHVEEHDISHACYTENYISRLRDAVAEQNPPFDNCALLIVHNSLLDTIINSALDLAQGRSIWSPQMIKEQLEGLISQDINSQVVSRCLLEHQVRLITEDGSSVFGFRHLHDSMIDGDLRFDEFGLFNDSAILNNSNIKQVERRLEANRQLRAEIEFAVEHYPNELEERLSKFGSKFIQKHFGENPEVLWTELDYGTFKREEERQKKNSLELETLESDGCAIHQRNKKETAAGLRDKHLMIVVPKGQDSFDFKIKFVGQKLEEKELQVQPKQVFDNLAIDHIPRGTRTTFHVSGPASVVPLFFTLRLNRDATNERYSFHCMVVTEGEFHLAGFENHFLINRSKEALILQAEQQVIDINPELEETLVLEDSGQLVSVQQYGKLDFQQVYEESDEVRFTLSNGASELTILVEGESSKGSLHLPLMLDSGRFSQLYSNDEYNAVYRKSKETVVLDNQESEPLFLRKQMLLVESAFVDEELVQWNQATGKGISASSLAMADGELYRSYMDLLGYFAEQKTLPSLASWGPKLVKLATTFVNTYIDYLNTLPKGHTLSATAGAVMELGFATIEGKKYVTPFHPLVIAYFVNLIEQIKADGDARSFRQLPEVTKSRLSPRGLIPHLYDPVSGYSYTQTVVQNTLWLELVPHQDSSFDFVSTLVRHKIEEFTSTFPQLYQQVEDAPILINSVNNGNNKELFKGLLSYYQTHLEKGLHVHVNLYDDEEDETEFDVFAEMGLYDEMKAHYRLDRGADRRNADTIVNLLCTRLTFSKFKHETTEKQAYAHLTFFKNNQKVEAVDNNIDDHLSGVACGGLLSGESSRSENGRFFTAFGLRGVDYSDKPHLQLAKLIGTLSRPSQSKNDVYHDHSAISLAVSEEFRSLLQRSYDSSVWTTIIDPKVTLEFFESTRDVILIHYSDQYTSSAGYDAITVTKQTELYKSVLGSSGDDLIREFNAFNGEWLLKLITDPSTEKIAKQGIIGAYKVVSTMLGDSDITWVPLSVAEMIRVAGNIGLAMSDSDFSRYNRDLRKGAISDDILFAGFKDGQLYLLPVEVKAGSRPNYDRARSQTLELKRYMEEDLLGPDTLEATIYRALFIRQVLLQIEKYQLYGVFDDDYFQLLLNEREYWLEGNYQIAQLPSYPKGMVVAHINAESCFSEHYEEKEGVLQVEIPMGILDALVRTPQQQLKAEIRGKKILQIPAAYFLNQALKRKPEASVIHDVSVKQSPAPTAQEETATEFQKNAEVKTNQLLAVSKDPLKVQFGTDVQTGQAIYWEPTNTEELFNTNTGIIGTMGTGKTQFTKSLITQLYRNQHRNVGGAPIGILIFDYKADYVKDDFVKATNAKVFELHNLPFNPFALFGNKPMLPRHTAEQFSATLAKSFGLGPKQQSKILSLVMEAYALAGIRPNDNKSWSALPPTLRDVWELFINQEKIDYDSLYAALDKLAGFEIFEPMPEKTQSLYDLLEGVVVINLSGYPDPIQNLVVALTLDLFYTQMHQKGSSQLDGKYRQISKMVLVDEADNFMSQDFESLRKILKEGREFGVGTILSTQELTHFKTGDNDYSSLILSWIIHQVANIKSQDVRSIFNTKSKHDEDSYMAHIRKLEKHFSLQIDGKKNIKKIKDLAFWEIS